MQVQVLSPAQRNELQSNSNVVETFKFLEEIYYVSLKRFLDIINSNLAKVAKVVTALV